MLTNFCMILTNLFYDYLAASINESQAPISSQPNTPSKLIGTSPIPSILRKRDVEG
jgi:hypothetical protein